MPFSVGERALVNDDATHRLRATPGLPLGQPLTLLLYLSLSWISIGWCVLFLGNPLAGLYAVLGSLCFLPCAVSGIRPHSMLQVTLALTFLAYVVAPLTSEHLPNAAIPRTLAFVIGFVGCLNVGYLLGPRLRSKNTGSPAGWRLSRVQAAAVILMGVGFVGWMAFVLFVGVGLGELYAYGHRIRLATNQVSWLYHARNIVIWCLWTACALALIPPFLTRGRLQGGDLLLATAAFGLLVLLVFPLGQRFYLFVPFIAVPISLSLIRRSPGIGAYLLAASLFGTALGVYAYYRNISAFEGASVGGILSALEGQSLLTLLRTGYSFSGDKLTTFALVVERWDLFKGPFLNGITYLNLPWLFVPQSLGFAKLAYTDPYLTQLLMPGSASGLAFGSVAELFINFGGAGVLVGGMVFGCILRLLDSWLSANAHRMGVLLWLSTGGIFIPFIVVGGLYSVTTLEFMLFSGLSVLTALGLGPQRQSLTA